MKFLQRPGVHLVVYALCLVVIPVGFHLATWKPSFWATTAIRVATIVLTCACVVWPVVVTLVVLDRDRDRAEKRGAPDDKKKDGQAP